MHLSNWVEYCGALRLAGTVYRAVLARTQTFNFISGTLLLSPSPTLAKSVAAWQHGIVAAAEQHPEEQPDLARAKSHNSGYISGCLLSIL